MDANGLRFWMVGDEGHWAIHGDPPLLAYDRTRRSLRLASHRPTGALPLEDEAVLAEAALRLERLRETRDEYGTRAYWDNVANVVMASGALPTPTPIFTLPTAGTPTDLAMGYDGVLYAAINGAVALQDRRERWDPVLLTSTGFQAWRLAADPTGGVWALDRDNKTLAQVQGLPFPNRPFAPYAANVFRPCAENPDPPRLTVLVTASLPGEENPVALACSPTGRLAVLCWLEGQVAVIRLLDHHAGVWGPPQQLLHAQRPYSLTWVNAEQIALLRADLANEALVYELGAPETDPAITQLEPVGDFYPLRRHIGDPFVNGVGLPPFYPTVPPATTDAEAAPTALVGLHRLSLPTFARQGWASNNSAAGRMVLDSGNSQTEWHRLYLEARIGAHCGIKVYLTASNDATLPITDPAEVSTAPDWYEHRFGECYAHNQPDANQIPRAVWLATPSELPYHPGLTLCERQPGRAGLFTVLIQRSGHRVRTLRGRYLHLWVLLEGDGRATPELWAVRAYGSRFSYRDRYLPSFYHETAFGADADQPLAAGEPTTPADFLDRFLANFEGVLTGLEDRIAHSYLLTDPRTAPPEALAWLGSWIGVSFDAAWPTARRRQLLRHATQLFRRRGTLAGLTLALDLATGGAVTRGAIVILEDWRLRRTFATILGVDLAQTTDPLLDGLSVSGNSYVGDTLILGDERYRDEVLAIFAPAFQRSAANDVTIRQFFDELAYRVTVLVRQSVNEPDRGVIRRVVELEQPAHIAVRIATASEPLLVGMTALVGVDTYLVQEQSPQPVTVGQSRIGVRDRVKGPASLDPRLAGGSSA